MTTSEAPIEPIAVTGLGSVSPCGNSVAELWRSLLAGHSGIAPISRFDTGAHSIKIGGEVRGFSPEDYGITPREARRLDLFAQYGLAAAVEAIGQSGLIDEAGRGPDPEKVGVAIGSGMGGLGSIEEQCEVFHTRGPRRVSPTLVPAGVPEVAAIRVSLRYGFQGPVFSISTACSSGSDAIIAAARCIREGTTEVMVAGGAEATITRLSIATFGNMKALSNWDGPPEEASRPFDRARAGFVMGEGAGVIVLESLDHARRRGARILALLTGHGQTSDAFHITAPQPDGAGAARAMRQALRMAGSDPGEVDYVNAHGTGTEQNDPMETRAIKTALGPEVAARVAVSSTKSMTGHLIGGAGGLEAVVAVQSILSNRVPPTINLTDPDPECDLDYVPLRAREMDVGVALSNTFGFGGHNSTLIFAAP